MNLRALQLAHILGDPPSGAWTVVTADFEPQNFPETAHICQHLAMVEAPRPWYRQPGWVLLLLLFVSPVGIALMWWGKLFTQNARIGLTVASALLFLAALGSSGRQQRSTSASSVSSSPTTPAPAPASQDRGQSTPAPKPPPPVEEEQPLAVPIRELLGVYKDNEVRADAAYKGKLIQTTGIVDDVKKDILDKIYVTVGTGEMYEIPTVQCYFAKSQEQEVMGLSKGNKVTVRGRVDGLMMNVLVKKCAVVQ